AFSTGDTFGSSFSARPAPAAAAYTTRGAVHSFAGPAPGNDYSSRHKDRWAPALDRLVSLRQRPRPRNFRARRILPGEGGRAGRFAPPPHLAPRPTGGLFCRA